MTLEAGLQSEHQPVINGPAFAGIPVDQRLQEAIHRASDCLLSLQAREGYWVGELQADTTLESDYIYYLFVLDKLHPGRVAKLANYIRAHQLSDGGWNIYEGGDAELNATVKAYFALKLAGDAIEAPHMARARRRVHELGGLEATNSFTRFYLALAGALEWKQLPAIPPELMLLPSWFSPTIYSMSSWTRAIVVPLMILYALKPRWSPNIRVDELFVIPSAPIPALQWDRRLFTAHNVFIALDRIYKLYEKLPWNPLRRRALLSARRWLLEHLERSDGLGAIYPAMVNAVFALIALGYPSDDPLTAREIDQLARFEIEEGDTLRVQPCLSPVWDTATIMVALEEAGLPADHPSLIRAAQWLIGRQVLGSGDWQVKNPEADPAAWAFEFRNDFYPDVDDTCFVLLALQGAAIPDRHRFMQALRRGLAWVLSMQNRDGGWASFDRDNDFAILTQVPFADHNAMIDPSTEDLTARTLECMGRFGWGASDPLVQRALRFLRERQTPEGAWYGRWGVNYIYGTSGVLRAFETMGLQGQPEVERALAWLRSIQNPDGGFGETCASYDDPSLKGQGPSTPSQTAWALIGFLAAGAHSDPAVIRAVEYLLDRQRPDGSWDEKDFTGTGFPCVFYLRYDTYRISFPLYALARYRNLVERATRPMPVHFSPKEFRSRNGNGNGRGR